MRTPKEMQEIIDWRRDEFKKYLGVDDADIAARTLESGTIFQVDVHRFTDLVEAGCEAELALSILL